MPERTSGLSVESYDIELRLDAPPAENGRPLAISNVLEVAAHFPYAVDGRGVRRATDPDGASYVYGMNFPTASARVFCCFDDPGLRASVKVTMSVPNGWTCLAPPCRPKEVRCHWLHAQRSRAAERDRGRQIADLMAQSITFYEHQLGLPYPYKKCEAVFVRDLPSLAFSTPGLILFADRVLDLIATRGPQYAATVVSHEIAHAWIGSLVDCGDAPWLVEACTTYLARNAVVHLLPGSRPCVAPVVFSSSLMSSASEQCARPVAAADRARRVVRRRSQVPARVRWGRMTGPPLGGGAPIRTDI
ncbi:MAG TPA: M1 family aminopeptidase [Amycolatopsis sp.]|nr:M1 family aminopeptidase [Amycolatopsis sp.]